MTGRQLHSILDSFYGGHIVYMCGHLSSGLPMRFILNNIQWFTTSCTINYWDDSHRTYHIILDYKGLQSLYYRFSAFRHLQMPDNTTPKLLYGTLMVSCLCFPVALSTLLSLKHKVCCVHHQHLIQQCRSWCKSEESSPACKQYGHHRMNRK